MVARDPLDWVSAAIRIGIAETSVKSLVLIGGPYIMKNNDLNDKAIVEQQDENQKGASLVEYALLVALIAVVCIVAMKTLGNSVSGKFSALASQVTATS